MCWPLPQCSRLHESGDLICLVHCCVLNPQNSAWPIVGAQQVTECLYPTYALDTEVICVNLLNVGP